MGKLTKLTSGGQITLPKDIRTKINMRPGDFVEVKLDEEGHIVLTPKKLVNASQAYYWTDEWQKGEREAEEDIRRGHVHSFDNAKDAVVYLHERAKKVAGEGKRKA